MIRQYCPRHSGKVKFAVSQRPNSHPFNFLYETWLYRGNAILEILSSKLKKIIRDSRILADKKVSDFLLSWIFVQKLLLAGRDVLLKRWERRSHSKHEGRLIRPQEFPHLIFLFHFSATVLYTRWLVIYSFMLLQALHVEIEMKNLNLQVTWLVQKGVGTSFPRVPTPLHPCWQVWC